jgi:hypothetical protein
MIRFILAVAIGFFCTTIMWLARSDIAEIWGFLAVVWPIMSFLSLPTAHYMVEAWREKKAKEN